MPDFVEAMTDRSRGTWTQLLLSKGLYLRQKTKSITIETKLETSEEISKIMTIKPGFDKREVT